MEAKPEIRDSIQLLLTAFFNSLVIDWFIRQKITTNLNFFYLYQLPIPRLTTGDPGFDEITLLAAKLICTTQEFDDLASQIVKGADHTTLGVTDPQERAQIRSQLDGMVAHLYSLSDQQFEHVLSTFPIVETQIKTDALQAYRDLLQSGKAAQINPQLKGKGKVTLPPEDAAVLELIAKGESTKVEFKATARWDIKQNVQATYMSDVIVKTAAAFLNSKGGTLLIGVADDGSIVGLGPDFATLGKRQDRDGFELWLMNLMLKNFGTDAAEQITITFHTLGKVTTKNQSDAPGSQLVCKVELTPSPRPRFVVAKDNQEVFYLRAGNASRQMRLSEFTDYLPTRWPSQK